MAESEKKNASEPAKETPAVDASPAPGWLGILAGLTASLGLLIATSWVIVQFIHHRPQDLRGPTEEVGAIAVEVLRNQGVPKEAVTQSESRLQETAAAHLYRTTIEADLSDALDPDTIINALERAFWRKQIIVASEEAAETEHTAFLSLNGFEVGEVHLHHAAPQPKKTPPPSVPPVHEKIQELPPAVEPITEKAEQQSAPELSEVSLAEKAPATSFPAGLWTPAFGPIVAGERPKMAQALPRIAIIVDDGGYGGEPAEIILALDPALTLSILPNTPHATSFAQQAHQRGFELMLHMPMENTSTTLVHPGQIDGEMNSAEIHRLTESALAQVPGAVGINNHTGSKFTANAKALGRFMSGIQDSGLFFVDSRTTQDSVAFEVARQYHIPTATRTLFLDNEKDSASIRSRFQDLIDDAKTQGTAIGICHFRPSTAEALREFLPRLNAEGVELVHVSELVR